GCAAYAPAAPAASAGTRSRARLSTQRSAHTFFQTIGRLHRFDDRTESEQRSKARTQVMRVLDGHHEHTFSAGWLCICEHGLQLGHGVLQDDAITAWPA